MAGYITRGQEKSVVLSAAQVDTLVRGGSGAKRKSIRHTKR